MLKQYPDEMTCNKCGVLRPLAEFPVNGLRPDGSRRRRAYCGECYNAYMKKYRLDPAAKAKYLEVIERWRRKSKTLVRRKTVSSPP